MTAACQDCQQKKRDVDQRCQETLNRDDIPEYGVVRIGPENSRGQENSYGIWRLLLQKFPCFLLGFSY
jgi:hypothetical protein